MINTEYLARNVWLVGSPETVARKAITLYEETGGFGSLLGMCFDFIDDMDAWLLNLDLMKNKVMPLVEAHVAASHKGAALKVA